MNSISQNVYIDKLDDVVNKCNNKYHSTNKIKPVDVKLSTYIDSSKEIHNKDPKFKIGDMARISKHTQPARDDPGTCPEVSLKVLTSETSRGPSGDS